MKKEFLDKVDQYKDIYQNNTPFPHIRLENLFSTELMEDVVENIYKNRDKKIWLNKMCTSGSDFSDLGKSVVKLTDYLVSDEWVHFLRDLTEIDDLYPDKTWFGAGVNFEPRGSHLEPHTDFNFRRSDSGGDWRRVNLLLFLSKDWKKEWGGQGELGHRNEVDEYVCDKKYNPDFNTAVIFSTSDISYHSFDIVRCPEDKARIVITSYYYSNDKGPHSSPRNVTHYIGWDKRRKQEEDYEQRHGTGFKELE